MITVLAKAEVPSALVRDSMKAAFGWDNEDEFYRYDYMYIGHGENMEPYCFCLCQEAMKDAVWLSFGGTVPEERGFRTMKYFKEMLAMLSEKYTYIGAVVESDNFSMLKIYLSLRFEIVGLKRSKRTGNMLIEFQKKVKEIQNG